MPPTTVALLCALGAIALLVYEVRRLWRKDQASYNGPCNYTASADPCGDQVLDPRQVAMYTCRRPTGHPPTHDDGRGHTWSDS